MSTESTTVRLVYGCVSVGRKQLKSSFSAPKSMIGLLENDKMCSYSNAMVVKLVRDFVSRNHKAFFSEVRSSLDFQIDALVDLTVTVSVPGYELTTLHYGANPFTTPISDKERTTPAIIAEVKASSSPELPGSQHQPKKKYGMTPCPKCAGTGVFKKKGQDDSECRRCFGAGEIFDPELAEQQKLADMSPEKRARLEKEADDDLYRGFAAKRR